MSKRAWSFELGIILVSVFTLGATFVISITLVAELPEAPGGSVAPFENSGICVKFSCINWCVTACAAFDHVWRCS